MMWNYAHLPLHTNIPTEQVTQTVNETLANNSLVPDNNTHGLLALTESTLNQHYFQFNSCYYEQTSGLSKGASTLAVWAEVFPNAQNIMKFPICYNTTSWVDLGVSVISWFCTISPSQILTTC
jgi:hypothetical protein